MKRIFPILALLLLPSCVVVNINPLVNSDAEAVFDESLIGVWETAKESGDSVTIERGEVKDYRISISEARDGGQVSVLIGRMVEIGAARYLEIFAPATENEPDNDIVRSLIIRGHMITRVRVEGDSVRFDPLRTEYFLERTGEGKSVEGLEFFEYGDRVVIRSPTESLRAFLMAHASDPGLFGEGDPWFRRK